MALAILIFQDIAVVPMMLLTPLLSGMNGQAHESLLTLFAKAIGIILLALVSAKWIVPKVLYQVARTQSRELFLLTILVICFAVASLTYGLGLSLALGAFLAGLVVSETEYSHQTLSSVLPFRDVFMSLFFVSIGMFLDMKFLMRQPVQVIFLALGVMTLKAFLANLAVILAGFPLRTAVLSGVALCQVGEFSFILFMKGTEYGLLSGDLYNLSWRSPS